MYSKLDLNGADKDGKTSFSTLTEQWMNLKTTTSRIWNTDIKRYSYNWTANSFNFDYIETKLTGVNLEMEYIPLEERMISFKGDNITATIPKSESVFDKVIAITSIKGELGNYKDVFNNLNTEINLGTIDATKKEAPLAILGSASGQYLERISSLNLGVTTKPLTTQTLQQKELQSLTSGATKYLTSKENPSESKMKTSLPITIKPEMIKYNQYLETRSADIYLDIEMGIYKDAGLISCSPVSTKSTYRNAGIHINNYYIQQEIKVQGKLFTDLLVNVPITNTFLAKPEINKGDFVWDLALTGTTGVDIVFVEGENIFTRIRDFFTNTANNIIWITLIGATVALVIFMYFKFGKPKSKLRK